MNRLWGVGIGILCIVLIGLMWMSNVSSYIKNNSSGSFRQFVLAVAEIAIPAKDRLLHYKLEDKLHRLRSTGACQFCDLSNAKLNGMNLRGLDLRNANFHLANLAESDLSGANLRNARLINTNLTDSNLQKAVLDNASLTNAILHRANLTDANLIETDLTYSVLTYADFQGANLHGADLRNTRLANANLSRANLTLANLEGTDLTTVALESTELRQAKLSRSNLSTNDLRFANFSHADLRGTNLSQSNLSNVNWSQTDFRSSNLSSANLSRSVFVEVNLKSANLNAANLYKTFFIRSDMSGAQVDTSDLESSILCYSVDGQRNKSQCNLGHKNLGTMSQQIRGLDLSGSDLSGANFQGLRFSDLTLKGSILSGANMKESVLVNIDFTGADLSLSKLEGAVIVRSSLKDARVSDKNLRSTFLCYVILPNGDKSGCDWSYRNLVGRDLSSLDLSGGLFNGADLSGTNLIHSNLSNAMLGNVNLNRANMYMLDLNGSNLIGADLSESNLVGANLENARLLGADISGARLHGSNFRSADVRKADLRGSGLTDVDLSFTNMYQADLGGVELHNFSNSPDNKLAFTAQGNKFWGVTSYDMFGEEHYLTVKKGLLYQIKDGKPEVVVDLNDSPTFTAEGYEAGLLSAVSSESLVYLSYTVTKRQHHKSDNTPMEYWLVVDEYSKIDFKKKRSLITIGPSIMHLAGALVFDSRGTLYLSVGDGGPQGDPDNHAQNRSDLRGKILSFDISQKVPEPEILAYGLRNPWKFSIDSNDRMFIADCGYDKKESLYLLDNLYADTPYNMGWPVFEGTERRFASSLEYDQTVPPIYEYSHFGSKATCIIGGYYIDYIDAYLFGDLGGNIRIIQMQKSGEWVEIHYEAIGTDIWSFGYDQALRKIYIGGSESTELILSDLNIKALPKVTLCKTVLPTGKLSNPDCE